MSFERQSIAVDAQELEQRLAEVSKDVVRQVPQKVLRSTCLPVRLAGCCQKATLRRSTAGGQVTVLGMDG